MKEAKQDFRLEGPEGKQKMFHAQTGVFLGQQSGKQWTGPSDSGDVLTAGSPQQLRDAQRAQCDEYF